MRRSLLALCIAHCSQFEHSGDFTMQSYNVLSVPYITVCVCPKCTNCHKAIMVIAEMGTLYHDFKFVQPGKLSKFG